jgi:hypothetical protein
MESLSRFDLFRLIFFSHNTIHSINKVLFILPSEQTLAGPQFKQAIAVVWKKKPGYLLLPRNWHARVILELVDFIERDVRDFFLNHNAMV